MKHSTLFRMDVSVYMAFFVVILSFTIWSVVADSKQRQPLRDKINMSDKKLDALTQSKIDQLIPESKDPEDSILPTTDTLDPDSDDQLENKVHSKVNKKGRRKKITLQKQTPRKGPVQPRKGPVQPRKGPVRTRKGPVQPRKVSSLEKIVALNTGKKVDKTIVTEPLTNKGPQDFVDHWPGLRKKIVELHGEVKLTVKDIVETDEEINKLIEAGDEMEIEAKDPSTNNRLLNIEQDDSSSEIISLRRKYKDIIKDLEQVNKTVEQLEIEDDERNVTGEFQKLEMELRKRKEFVDVDAVLNSGYSALAATMADTIDFANSPFGRSSVRKYESTFKFGDDPGEHQYLDEELKDMQQSIDALSGTNMLPVDPDLQKVGDVLTKFLTRRSRSVRAKDSKIRCKTGGGDDGCKDMLNSSSAPSERAKLTKQKIVSNDVDFDLSARNIEDYHHFVAPFVRDKRELGKAVNNIIDGDLIFDNNDSEINIFNEAHNQKDEQREGIEEKLSNKIEKHVDTTQKTQVSRRDTGNFTSGTKDYTLSTSNSKYLDEKTADVAAEELADIFAKIETEEILGTKVKNGLHGASRYLNSVKAQGIDVKVGTRDSPIGSTVEGKDGKDISSLADKILDDENNIEIIDEPDISKDTLYNNLGQSENLKRKHGETEIDSHYRIIKQRDEIKPAVEAADKIEKLAGGWVVDDTDIDNAVAQSMPIPVLKDKIPQAQDLNQMDVLPIAAQGAKFIQENNEPGLISDIKGDIKFWDKALEDINESERNALRLFTPKKKQIGLDSLRYLLEDSSRNIIDDINNLRITSDTDGVDFSKEFLNPKPPWYAPKRNNSFKSAYSIFDTINRLDKRRDRRLKVLRDIASLGGVELDEVVRQQENVLAGEPNVKSHDGGLSSWGDPVSLYDDMLDNVTRFENLQQLADVAELNNIGKAQNLKLDKALRKDSKTSKVIRHLDSIEQSLKDMVSSTDEKRLNKLKTQLHAVNKLKQKIAKQNFLNEKQISKPEDNISSLLERNIIKLNQERLRQYKDMLADLEKAAAGRQRQSKRNWYLYEKLSKQMKGSTRTLNKTRNRDWAEKFPVVDVQ